MLHMAHADVTLRSLATKHVNLIWMSLQAKSCLTRGGKASRKTCAWWRAKRCASARCTQHQPTLIPGVIVVVIICVPRACTCVTCVTSGIGVLGVRGISSCSFCVA